MYKTLNYFSSFCIIPVGALTLGATQLDAGQGASEEQTEIYMKYIEGVPELATQPGASSNSGATGFAGRQAIAVCGS